IGTLISANETLLPDVAGIASVWSLGLTPWPNLVSFRRGLNAQLKRTVTNWGILPIPWKLIGRSAERSQPGPERGDGVNPAYFCVVNGSRRGCDDIITSRGERDWHRRNEIYLTRFGDQPGRYRRDLGGWEVVRADIPDTDGYIGTAMDRGQEERNL